MPEQDSSPDSVARGRLMATHLDIAYQIHDITPALAALGCYEHRNHAMKRVFPDYDDGWKSKIVIARGTGHGINFFKLVVQSPDGDIREARLPAREYLEIVAATNFKQRVRKTMEYFHADRLHYAVVGTPNRLEHDQGFFVKNGDGSADLKPIAHLYKTQVYGLARWLALPDEICEAVPTTDTYTLAQGQDEFYFALPYQQMDLALWAFERWRSASELAEALGIDEARAARVYLDIETKRRAASYLHAAAAQFAPTGESPR
jgi:NAD+ synthase